MSYKIFLKFKIGFTALYFLSCSNYSKKEQQPDLQKTSVNSEKIKILKIAEEIAFKEYGDIIKSELPLKAKLMGDSIWVVEGTIAKDADGGTVYIELTRKGNKLIKITHYK